MKYIFLVFFIWNLLEIDSQNLIVNPDFSDISVFYENGRKVYPNNWKSFYLPPFLGFYHRDKTKDGDFLSNSTSEKTNGIVNISPYGNGICTKLMSKLKSGETYDIAIELKIDKLNVNSLWKGRILDMNGNSTDSAELDYNYIMSLVTFFTKQEPKVNENLDRGFAILDFPSNITPDSSKWMVLSTSYLSKGDEEYFTIGTFNKDDYVKILRNIKHDLTDYYHKYASYLIRNVSVTKHANSHVNYCFIDSFEQKIVSERVGKIIIRKVNFCQNCYELTTESKKELNHLVEFLKKNEKISIEIIGHTDSIGTVQFNQVLSEKRAKAVYDYLVKNGINSTRLKYEGKGESQPLNETQIRNNFGYNRRVEFEFKRYK